MRAALIHRDRCAQKHNPALRLKDMADVETNRLQRRTDRQGIHLVQCDWTKRDWSEWPYLELCSRKWERDTHTQSVSLNVLAGEEEDWERVCVSVPMRERESERSGARMNYAGCSLECRVLADRVPFSLICLWFIFHSNFSMCSFKHTENRKPRAVELACSRQIKSSPFQRRSDTKWEKINERIDCALF